MGIFLKAIDYLLLIMEYAIFARVILSWLPMMRNNNLVRLIYQITEPILAPLRELISRSSIGANMIFDFSPVLAFLLIGLIRNLIYRLIYL